MIVQYMYISIICIEFIFGLWVFLRLNRLRQVSSFRKKTFFSENPQTNFVIAIPCLREQDILRQTLNHFAKMSYKSSRIAIIVITTEKENYEKQLAKKLVSELVNDLLNKEPFSQIVTRYNQLLPTSALKKIHHTSMSYQDNEQILDLIETVLNETQTTPLLAASLVKELNIRTGTKMFYHIHYPKPEGMMAHQLNFLLENLSALKIPFVDELRSYFAVYNADSKPDISTFQSVNEELQGRWKNREVIQQYSIYTENWDKLSGLMKGGAILQSNLELTTGLANAMLPSSFLYSYVMGHGLFIRIDKLREIGGFETDFWCEDIYMSYLLCCHKIKIHSIPAVENAQHPEHLPISIRQAAVWFNTASKCFRIWSHIRKKYGKQSFTGLIWLTNRFFMNINWLCSPFLIIFTFVYPLFIRDYSLFLIAILAYVWMMLAIYLSTLNTIKFYISIRIKHSMKLFLSTMIAKIISNLGPMYSVWLEISKLLFKRKLEKFKTAR